jgi:signal transduction histidine kinase
MGPGGVVPPMPRWLSGLLTTVALVAAVSGVLKLLEPHAPVLSLSVLYQLAVVPVAIVWGVRQAMVASLLSTVAFAVLFLPPQRSLGVIDSRYVLVLLALLLTSVVVGELAARSRQRARESARLAEEQAALRRVATLVARSTVPAEVFEAVTREVGLRSGADLARMERYEADGTVTGVARWSRQDDPLAVGTRIPLEGVSIAALVRQTSRPVRVDSFSQASGPIAQEARALGIRSSVGCPIVVGSRLWGVIAASSKREAPFPAGTESQIADFTELVATAIANAESRSALAASRARVVAAADETRRRIERDLHDGIQQRLVSLGLELRLAQSEVAAVAPAAGQELDHVAEELKGAIDELREISHGIHPSVLSEGGLGPALRNLARRSAVPVDLELAAEDRLPEPVEVAAYYVVSEALTNTTKHARASYARVTVQQRDSVLWLSVGDDGVGGAEPARGSGLIGLRDRVEALGGSIEVTSHSGEGTVVAVELPLQPA